MYSQYNFYFFKRQSYFFSTYLDKQFLYKFFSIYKIDQTWVNAKFVLNNIFTKNLISIRGYWIDNIDRDNKDISFYATIIIEYSIIKIKTNSL